jgi:hypothetical protein
MNYLNQTKNKARSCWRGGLDEILAEVAVDLIARDPVEHDHDPHGKGGVKTMITPSSTFLPHLGRHHILVVFAIVGLGRHDAVGLPREQVGDAELYGSSWCKEWRRRSEEVEEHGLLLL